jgi:hypothetical protein
LTVLLDPVALALASWAGLGVGVVGTIVSLVGLTLTFREARRARDAALAARVEVEKVLSLVRSRSRLSALSSAVQQADTISARISKDGLKTGRDAFTQFQRSVKEALAVMVVQEGNFARDTVEQVEQQLERIGRLIQAEVENKARKAQMHDALENVTNFLLTQEARVKTEDLT